MAFLGINQFWRVGLRFVCWFYDGNTQKLTESGFMEKPGIEPATPGLQDIGLSPTPRRLLIIRKDFVCGRVPWLYQYWPGVFMVFVVLCPGTPEGSTGSGSGFKASQKTGQRLKVSSDRLREAGNRTCDLWFTRHRFIPYTTAALQRYKQYHLI